jgi:cytochrome c5
MAIGRPHADSEGQNMALRIILGTVIALLVAAPVAASDGKAVWDKNCAGCHSMMAPKWGDKAAWAPFVKLGVEPVTSLVVKGKGAMPPMGGAKTEADIKAAVEYALEQMK